MGLSKKRTKTNIEILRSELNRLNMDANDSIKKDEVDAKELPKQTTGSGSAILPSDGPKSIIREAKRRGRKKNAIIDGALLLTC